MKTTIAIMAAISCLQLFPSISFADPTEQPVIQISRDANSQRELTGEISKNVIRNEQHQETYEERVPYNETESYEVRVPYDETETYSEQVPYYVNESYEVQVPYQYNEPYTEYETFYTTETQCHNEPYRREVCQMEKICPPLPPLPPPGHPRPPAQPCHDERRCTFVNDYQSICRDIQVSHTRAVTRFRTVTRYRTEIQTRTVTHYITETRTRTVTHYRNETRTRTVTKYRTETRTRTVDVPVFDHQYKVAVVLQFDATSGLKNSETEVVNVTLTGSEAQPDAEVTVESAVFTYQVVSKNLQGQTLTVQLSAGGKYQPEQLGVSTIAALSLTRHMNGLKPTLNLDDQGQLGRTTTYYRMRLIDPNSLAVLYEQEFSPIAGSSALSLEVNYDLAANQNAVLWLRTYRTGPSIAGGSTLFVKEVQAPADNSGN